MLFIQSVARFSKGLTYAWVAATLCVAPPAATPASAEGFFSFFESSEQRPAPRAAANVPDMAASPVEAAPAIGAWTTVVIAMPATPVARAGGTIRAGSPGAAELPPPAGPRLTGTGHSLSGVASYYWQDQMTAMGERFNRRDMTAAHKTLPFGTRVRVTRVDTGSSVIVRINDRGPFKPGRVIDLSERAAEEIGMTGVGLSPVRLEVLGQ